MILNAPTIILILIIIIAACYGGLRLIRKFALQIAQENHDAIAAMDAADDEKRLRRERAADQAAATAFAKVQPLLPTISVPAAPSSNSTGGTHLSTASSTLLVPPTSTEVV